MKRSLGCFSVYGVLAALVVAFAMTGWTLLRGPTLFSPGRLTAVREGTTPIQGYASHAEMESRCTLCHRPWLRVATARCVTCHTAVENEVAAGIWLHGELEGPEECVACHPDHLGREADIVQPALDRYSHDQTGFSLVRHRQLADGTDLVCTDCHVSGEDALDPTMCAACHRQMDVPFTERHIAEVGAGCLSCHDGRTIPDAFDHGAVFPIDGAHADLACDTCHLPGAVTRLSGGCLPCHEEPSIHRGGFGLNCAACHTVDGWQPARLRVHTFPLDHGRQIGEEETPCLTCHPEGYAAYTCYGCHEHQAEAIERTHRERSITEIADCARCHPTGEEKAG
jgi:hypothetical protein